MDPKRWHDEQNRPHIHWTLDEAREYDAAKRRAWDEKIKSLRVQPPTMWERVRKWIRGLV